ncbi:Rv1355c family protein [Jiangella alba]|uniref:ThiF family protein n=1 Tax=Jiangella alba TaxID=561176 RepID=A0A1H5PQ53_9ACTN|nr:Rv1355c family protein [Jiangella alba]SEF15916.1 ThiF family protein [Jiangella alba]
MTDAVNGAGWRPELVTDPERLAALRADPAVQVADTLGQQQRDLARLLSAAPPEVAGEPARWFYYPWRRTLVQLLGPEAFHRLRTDRNRNKITAEEQQRLRRLSVGVAGLSVGHAIAHTLALEGSCGHIRLADFDEIELSNLNRIPGTVFDLGVNKAVVVARRIAELDPYIEVSIEPAGLTLETVDRFLDGLDVVVEECDSFDVKLALRDGARRHRLPLVMETSDRGLLDVERYDLEPDRPLFHGLLGDARPADLMGLSTHDKVPYVLRVLEPGELSASMAASMTEVDETLNTWPQLGGDITLGAATVAAAVRKLGLGAPVRSGRVRVDLDAVLSELADPPPAADADFGADLVVDPEPAPTLPRATVVHAARLAPSGGNTQPWAFTLSSEGLAIDLDRTQTSTLDVAFRGSHVAIGAALFNARVAAARHGLLGAVEIPADGDHVATLRFGSGTDPELAGLYDAMLRRVSNRHFNGPAPLPPETTDVLRAAAAAEDGDVHLVTGREPLRQLAELLGESDRLRYLTEHLHREMMRELRWPGVDALDWGIDVRTLELDRSDLAKLGVARRSDVMAVLAEQDLGRALGESTRDRVEAAAGLAVVSVAGSSPADYVRGGQAVERVWIEAERLGLAVHPMSPVFIFGVDDADFEELSPRYSDRLRRLRDDFAGIVGLGRRHVALVMRIGYAPSVSVRSRRLSADRTVRDALEAGRNL